VGNGWHQTHRIVQTPDNVREYGFETDRRWATTNPSRIPYSSGNSVGCAIGAERSAIKLIAKLDLWIAGRATLRRKALGWVEMGDCKRFRWGSMCPNRKLIHLPHPFRLGRDRRSFSCPHYFPFSPNVLINGITV